MRAKNIRLCVQFIQEQLNVRHFLCDCRGRRCRCLCKIWRFFVKPFLRYSFRSLRYNDRRWTTTLRPVAVGLMWQVAMLSFVVSKWTERIFQERFDKESPNFTQASAPPLSSVTQEMTLLATSVQKLCRKTMEMLSPKTEVNFSGNRLTQGRENFPPLPGTIWHSVPPRPSNQLVSCLVCFIVFVFSSA